MKIDAKNNLKWGGKFSHVPQNHHSQRMCTKVVDHNGHIKFELTTTNPSHLPTAHIVPDENDSWKWLKQGIMLWLFFSAVSRLSLGIQNLKITWDYSRMTAKYSLCWLCALCTVGRWQRLIVIKLNLIWPFFIFLTFMNILDVQNSVFSQHFYQSLESSCVQVLQNTVNVWDRMLCVTLLCLQQFRWTGCGTRWPDRIVFEPW